jgi:hypothetical protein
MAFLNKAGNKLVPNMRKVWLSDTTVSLFALSCAAQCLNTPSFHRLTHFVDILTYTSPSVLPPTPSRRHTQS